MTLLTYAVVTPARNEVENLERLGESMVSQSRPPTEWIIVDNASTDRTADVIHALTTTITWARSIDVPRVDSDAARGAPVVRGFHAGLAALSGHPDVVVKLDADVAFEPDFFARILAAFQADPKLGITGGLCLERDAAAHGSPITWREGTSAARLARTAGPAWQMSRHSRSAWAGTGSTNSKLV